MCRIFQILCFSTLFLFVYSSELQHEFSDEDNEFIEAYDVSNLFKRSLSHYPNSHKFRTQQVPLEFQMMYKTFAEKIIEYFSVNSTQCARDLLYTGDNLKSPWALKMLDSFGKPGSGLLEGLINWLGEYTECTQVYAPLTYNWNNSTNSTNSTEGDFHGQYCTLKWTFKLSNRSISVSSGVCVPDSCSDSEIQGEIENLLKTNESLYNGTRVNVECKKTKHHLNAPAIAVIFLLSFFSTLVVFGSSVTAVKYFMEMANASSRKSSLVAITQPSDLMGDQNGKLKQNSNSDDDLLLGYDKSPATFYDYWKICEPFFECFCIFRNGAKLLNTTVGEGELLCIHGIRFLSMSWVILGHTYVFTFANLGNLFETVESTTNFAFQIVLQGFFSVDSFFVLSGFLLTYLSMREFSKNAGGISWPYFYIHRYLRLTPIYMIILGFSASVYLYLGAGPFWPNNDSDPICKYKWWWNLLYINNFADWSDQCMGWSWYLANDMQFFVISPLFLITLWRWPIIGCSLVAYFLFICWVANFAITYEYDLMAGIATILNHPIGDLLQTLTKSTEYFTKVYSKPYTRIAPYLIGILTGYIFFERKRNNKPKHNWAFLSVGWTVASTITLVCVYGLYHKDPSLVARSFYNAFSRTTFAIGLCWVIYVCLMEQGGFVNSILSFKMFIPLSRLTYSAYLIHPMIISGYYTSLKVALHFSHPTMVFLFLGFMVATYGLALPVTLVLESPIIALEKLIRSSFSRKK